jgi:hypothetical protein
VHRHRGCCARNVVIAGSVGYKRGFHKGEKLVEARSALTRSDAP